jgi:hypothetical protein
MRPGGDQAVAPAAAITSGAARVDAQFFGEVDAALVRTSPILALMTASACSVTELTTHVARAIVEQLTATPSAVVHLVECRRVAPWDALVLDLTVDVPQGKRHDIRRKERLLIVVDERSPNDEPEIWALRTDFPRDVPHLNRRPRGFPPSLCISETSFRERAARWTPARYLHAIRDWLRLTSRGELHQGDQPLEPFLEATPFWVILPSALTEQAIAATASVGVIGRLSLAVRPRALDRRHFVLVAEKVGGTSGQPSDAAVRTTLIYQCSPRVHGTIHLQPTTLRELHDLLAAGGEDLLSDLRREARNWEEKSQVALGEPLVLVVIIPMLRENGTPAEAVEVKTFQTEETLADVSVKIGAWEMTNGTRGCLVIPDLTADGEAVRLHMAQTFFRPTLASLAQSSGYGVPVDVAVLAVGAGALGSQVIQNACRGGWGRWTIVEPDALLPHNLARHALFAFQLGTNKGAALLTLLGELADDATEQRAMEEDVLVPSDPETPWRRAANAAELIVDMAASVAVSRHLALDLPDAKGRRISLFLSPSGSDLVMLAEDSGRKVPLDVLEMQSYRAIAREPGLARLLLSSDGQRVRVGQSCRDLSMTIAQPMVALHAGQATLALMAWQSTAAARAAIWCVTAAGATTLHEIPVSPALECTRGDWTIVADEWFLDELAKLRAAKLPRETGGVLLGQWDFSRRRVYLIDVLPSPPDSQEFPTSYIRGSAGLKADIDRRSQLTADQLEYIGEWHSHPDGESCTPSGDDRILFASLQSALGSDGVPPVMLIVGQDGDVVPFLDTAMLNDVRAQWRRVGHASAVQAETAP